MANTTTITGNLTREPEIRYTREGQATAQLGVAVNRRWQDRTTHEWQESTSFFDVICWRDLAENVALSLTKGMRVVVTGRLEHRTPAPVRSHTQDIQADGVRRIYGYLAAADRNGVRSRPISSASVTATRIIVNAAPEKMSPRAVRPLSSKREPRLRGFYRRTPESLDWY